MKRIAGTGGVLALVLCSRLAAAQGAANRLPSGPGHDEVTQACSACHGLDIVTGRRLSRADWQTTVDNMIARGAKLTDPQAAQVVAYLTQNFGLTPPAQNFGLTPPAAATAGGALVAGPRGGGRGQNRTTYGNRPDGMGPGASPFLPPKQRPRSPADTARPVTDAMLVNPPPESWLNWRRTYDDHGLAR